jgi:aerobic carbon-monoxide dehydrogenase large subunit
MPPAKFGFGGAARRKEDDALLRGAGRYVVDHAPAGALHAVVLRSPHAHARFRIADVAKARAMPGVALVLTGGDTAELGDLPCQGAIPETELAAPPYPILARGEVRHVGDAVAFAVADTLDRARDAAEAVAIEWTPLPHVVGAVAGWHRMRRRCGRGRSPRAAILRSRPSSAMPRERRGPLRAPLAR